MRVYWCLIRFRMSIKSQNHILFQSRTVERGNKIAGGKVYEAWSWCSRMRSGFCENDEFFKSWNWLKHDQNWPEIDWNTCFTFSYFYDENKLTLKLKTGWKWNQIYIPGLSQRQAHALFRVICSVHRICYLQPLDTSNNCALLIALFFKCSGSYTFPDFHSFQTTILSGHYSLRHSLFLTLSVHNSTRTSRFIFLVGV